MNIQKTIHKHKVRLAYQQLRYNQQSCPFWPPIQTQNIRFTFHNTAHINMYSSLYSHFQHVAVNNQISNNRTQTENENWRNTYSKYLVSL